MSVQATLSFAKGGHALFTRDEVKHLMWVEYERSRRYAYPVACMYVSVDHLDSLRTVHGLDSADTIYEQVLALMKAETRASDFMGCLDDGRVLAIFPQVSARDGNELAERLLERARGLEFETQGVRLKITLSIGLSHSQRERMVSFDTLVKVAEEGLVVADNGGGDRFVETELYELYERCQEEVQAARETSPAGQVIATEGEEFERAAASFAEEIVTRALERLEGKLQGIELSGVEADAQQPPVSPAEPIVVHEPVIDDEAIAREIALREEELQRKVEDEKAALAEREGIYKREIDNLQRRIKKLSESLGVTEEELKRAYKLKSVDQGLSSIYRDVQGLSPDDNNFEVKRDLMSAIFNANMDLQKRSVA